MFTTITKTHVMRAFFSAIAVGIFKFISYHWFPRVYYAYLIGGKWALYVVALFCLSNVFGFIIKRLRPSLY